jgi:regulator of sigma E protease
MNLLPIPPLDGGKIVVEIVQAIRRKPLTQKVNFIISAAGLALLVVFMVYVMGNDILRLIRG